MKTLPAEGLPFRPAAFDVIIGSDLRFPGGTSHSISEEVTAQHRAGHRTGLVHLNGPLVRKVRPINPLIRQQITTGAAELIVGRRPVRTRLLVLRHPAVAQRALDQMPPVNADQVVIVANAGSRGIDGRTHYTPRLVDRAVRKHLGQDPLWAPIGPLVREELAPHVPADRMLDEDWVNIIDVDAWAAHRPGWVGERPVIGRHSRPSAQKWPADATTLRQVYPVDGSWEVRILGGAQPVAELLGSVPETWQVQPFGAQSPKEFLAGLDFFVYYHDPRWVEAFGRTILEAMASGTVAILPPHFEALFADAAVYAPPAQVRSVVTRLRADPDAYEAQAARAQAVVRSQFGHEAHNRRLDTLLAPGTHTPAGAAPDPDTSAADTVTRAPRAPAHLRPRAAGSRSGAPRVLLMSSNGAGMGHLTRLLAYSRRMDQELEPYFFSMSQAAPLVAPFGFRYEYLPSTGALEMAPAAWQRLFVSRMTELLDRVRPRVVVFDGIWPYNGFPIVREAFGHIPWIWSRRGMWRKGANTEQVRKQEWFDQVIEPGDFASAYDRGATRGEPATRVSPVTLLDRDELQERDEARTELGLPLDRRLGLISLGAGNINDTSNDVGAAAAALRRLDLDVCVTQAEIATDTAHDRVHVVRDYPLARRLAAFDVVISAAGYNSFQELMRMGVANLLVPNTHTALDDQVSRARFAQEQGWSHSVPRIEQAQVLPLLSDLLERGAGMVAQAAERDAGNGAGRAAAMIAELAHRGHAV